MRNRAFIYKTYVELRVAELVTKKECTNHKVDRSRQQILKVFEKCFCLLPCLKGENCLSALVCVIVDQDKRWRYVTRRYVPTDRL